MSLYTVKQPGDVLRLDEDLSECAAGLYVLLSIGDFCCLSLAGEDDNGDLCTTLYQVMVPLADLCKFKPIGMAVTPL